MKDIVLLNSQLDFNQSTNCGVFTGLVGWQPCQAYKSKSGLVVNKNYLFLGASPEWDLPRQISFGSEVSLQAKCTCRCKPFSEVVEQAAAGFCLKEDDCNCIALDRNHYYFYQPAEHLWGRQMLLYCMGPRYSHVEQIEKMYISLKNACSISITCWWK